MTVKILITTAAAMTIVGSLALGTHSLIQTARSERPCTAAEDEQFRSAIAHCPVDKPCAVPEGSLPQCGGVALDLVSLEEAIGDVSSVITFGFASLLVLLVPCLSWWATSETGGETLKRWSLRHPWGRLTGTCLAYCVAWFILSAIFWGSAVSIHDKMRPGHRLIGVVVWSAALLCTGWASQKWYVPEIKQQLVDQWEIARGRVRFKPEFAAESDELS